MAKKETLKTDDSGKKSGSDNQAGKDTFWKKHPIFSAFLKALIFVLVFFVTGELLVRRQVAGYRSVPRHEGGVEFKPDPEIFWKLRPNLNMLMKMPKGGEFTLQTNRYGIRNPEIPLEKPQGGYRVECYGDSITYGHGVNSPDTYEMQLQDILRGQYGDKPIDVVNFGCPGYTSFQGWRLFNRLGVKYEPDLCVLAYNYADPSAEEMKDEDRVPKNPAVLAIKKFLYGSELYLALRQQKMNIDKQGKQPDYYLTSVRVPLPEYELIMKNWAGTMKKRNGHVIYLSLAYTTPDPFDYYADYRNACKRIAGETGNYFIDMNQVFRESGKDLNSLFLLSVAENEEVDRIHPNEEGFKLMARAIGDLIIKEGLVEKK